MIGVYRVVVDKLLVYFLGWVDDLLNVLLWIL